MSTVILVLTVDSTRIRRLSGEIPGARIAIERARSGVLDGIQRGYHLLLVDADEFAADIPVLAGAAKAAGVPMAVFTSSPTLEFIMRYRAEGAADVMGVPVPAERVKALLGSRGPNPDWKQAARISNEHKWIGQSRQVLAAFNAASDAATSEAAVLIVGERGVGKELLARIIHDGSSRTAQPFVSLNCGALDGNLAAELFGNAVKEAEHVGPAIGLLERAAGGTLFLDEITRMPAGLQWRLADALNRGVYHRLGSLEEFPLRTRIIAASHADVKAEREQGRFREDLLYAFGVQIYIPPLRQRPDDVPLLASYFLEAGTDRAEPPTATLSQDALNVMRRYDWPGNVRQLHNAVERAALAARGASITTLHLPPEVTGRSDEVDIIEHEDLTIAALERRHIRHVLQLTSGKLTEAADLLGIHRNTLRRKLEEYGI